eukprot:8416652-Prorocentrum_lima.AAC.1
MEEKHLLEAGRNRKAGPKQCADTSKIYHLRELLADRKRAAGVLHMLRTFIHSRVAILQQCRCIMASA